ncbi:MAG: hypothetical protein R3B45_17685 [Bdellovibrionota bacterium]
MVREIPKWSSEILSIDGLVKIEEAVRDAESATSAEIVPMIVRGSAVTGHVAIILFCFLFILFLGLGLDELQSQYLTNSPIWLFFDIAIFSMIAVWLSRYSFVKRQLTSNEDLYLQVGQRAELEFYEAELNRTAGRSGVLIFLSLMEKRVVVLADKTIADKLHKTAWQEVVDILLSGLKKKNDLAQGFCDAIKSCGTLLSQHFPIEENDTNELRDHLIIKE